ncbi:MAG: purine-binding chemotaxis protein CheW [Bradyrhizobium sp.]|nr:purine-binding chemotaxis protein CheW [Bradyrhizobium sp.]
MADSRQNGNQRYLTFRSEDRLYALPSSQVAEVIRMTSLARVPQAPKSLLGLANLRGVVMPVAGVRSLLGRAEAAATSISRLIVLDGATPVALAVDEVAALVTVPESEVKSEDTELSALAGEELRGIFQTGGKVTKILDIQALLARSFPEGASKRTASVVVAAKANQARPNMDERRRLVTFDVAGQEYALDLRTVQEIVVAPGNLTHIPGSDDAVMGVMPYRETLLPLMSMRVLLGLPSASLSRCKVIVTTVGKTSVGLVVDGTRSLLTVNPSLLEKAPPILNARAGGEAQIAEIYRADRARLISVLVPDRLFREEVMQKLTGTDLAMNSTATRPGEALNQDLRVLAFKLNDNEFALPIDAVDEVARVPDQITRLPKTPKFLEGVVNLRGVVLPVVDQRRRFDMPAIEETTGRRLVVVRSEEHRAGLIVDSVTEVLRCAPEAIKPAPDFAGEAAGLVRSVINLEAAGRMLLLLDPAELLSRAERSLLDSFNKDASFKSTKQPRR